VFEKLEAIAKAFIEMTVDVVGEECT